MSLSLTQLMRQLVLKPNQPLVQVPVLVWEAPPQESSPDEDWAPTETGFKTRPTAADPLVFPLAKVPGRANPFAMGVTVGRVETNDVIVDDGSVSRFHAWLQLDERKKQWFLCDAESKNGTFLGPQRLSANQKVLIADGAQVKFGDAQMSFLSPASLVKLIRQRGEATPSRQASKR
ncbi:MAG: FHA domain-containing protein [Myxococcaceae bacterium]|nr:FHA domain-containing protein [Myxococcaceae bacterium]